MKRVLTALLLIPVVTVVVFCAPLWGVLCVMALAVLLCLHEFYGIADLQQMHPFRLVGYAAGVLLVVSTELPQPAFFVVLTAALMLLSLQRGRTLESSLTGVASTLLGVIYVGGPFALARDIHAASPHWLFLVLVLNWVGDAAAYYAGRAFGRHKLAPRISPNKTWEGTLASGAAAISVGAAYLHYFQPVELHLFEVVLLAASINIAAQFGDLAESALKRGAQVKDSGAILPGHGGMLDRLDGVLFSFVAAYLCLRWML